LDTQVKGLEQDAECLKATQRFIENSLHLGDAYFDSDEESTWTREYVGVAAHR